MFDAAAIKELSQSEAIHAANENIVQHNAIALPSDFKVHDLEKYMPSRRRARGTMGTSSLDAFAQYVTTHADKEGAAVFVDQARMRAVAVLNLGSTEAPGHADDTAELCAKMTAPYAALSAINGRGQTQQATAEFLEDWAANILACSAPSHDADDTAAGMETKRAVAAIRAITIEAARKTETKVQSLSQERSDFERVQATSSAAQIPTEIMFRCMPYHGLAERTFTLRLGITTAEKPSIILRVAAAEKHAEEMAEELAALVASRCTSLPVLLGTYQAGA